MSEFTRSDKTDFQPRIIDFKADNKKAKGVQMLKFDFDHYRETAFLFVLNMAADN